MQPTSTKIATKTEPKRVYDLDTGYESEGEDGKDEEGERGRQEGAKRVKLTTVSAVPLPS